MRVKDVDFKQPIRLLINGVEYDFSNRLFGSQKALNKGSIVYEDVIPKNLSSNEAVRSFTIFPKFARVEHYYGNDLFFLGFIREQTGTANPFQPKYVRITVLDGKDWLTQSELIGKVYIDEPYEAVVDSVIEKINLPFIKKGKMQFSDDGLIEAWDSDEIDAYAVLRFIERQSNTLLQILLEADKTYSINFFDKSQIANPDGNKGNDLIIDTPEKLKAFHDQYVINDITWKKSGAKDCNIVRVSSERVVSSIAIHQKIELSIANEGYALPEKIGRFDEDNSVLTDSSGKKIRSLRIIPQDDVSKGRNYDIAFEEDVANIEINESLLKTTDILDFKYYPIRRGTVQFDNNADQLQIAAYTGGTGRKARYEKHNDAGVSEHLIKYARNYLKIGLEDKLQLMVELTKAPWNTGEHVAVKMPQKDLDGIYYVKEIKLDAFNHEAGQIIGRYEYTLTKTSDFEEHLNFYDDQSYRQKPVFKSKRAPQSFDNIHINLKVLVLPGSVTCAGDGGLEEALGAELSGGVAQSLGGLGGELEQELGGDNV